MNILFHLGHPAHFHLFKNVIKKLNKNDHTTSILIKKKDILEDLLIDANIEFYNILPKARKDSKFSMAFSTLKKDFNLLLFCLKNKPNLLIGTSSTIAHIGWILKIPSLVVNEDDAQVVPLFAKLAYPLASVIISPDVCNNGRWENKSVKYNSYHELAYLHPDHFTPKIDIATSYIDISHPYVLLRFASLGAHHDAGIEGINDDLALRIIKIIQPYANVFITSERKLCDKLEQFRLKINPLDIHHVMAFALMYIGDSQTMAAEAGVLGVPFVRYNDFVGKIGYLSDLEDNFGLGFGIKPRDKHKFFDTIKILLKKKTLKIEYQQKRKVMLQNKINLSEYLYNLIVNFKSKNLNV